MLSARSFASWSRAPFLLRLSLRYVPDSREAEFVGRLRLLIADKNPAMRRTLAELVHEDCDIVAEVGDGPSVLQEIESAQPNVILLGVSFEGTSGFEIARRLLLSKNKVKVIFVSFHESRDLVRAALARGASGYVFMSRLLDDLPAAIEAVSNGRIFEPAP
ncbi:MAG TPA: response regulator transcription factor [Verrucomicrobiae bacterium]|nr:response regulator transcription factor [Verrucomicrobiae bacterium]